METPEFDMSQFIVVHLVLIECRNILIKAPSVEQFAAVYLLEKNGGFGVA